MKYLILIGIMAFGTIPSWAADAISRPVATMTKVSGIVEVLNNGNWSPAVDGTYLYSESRLRSLSAGGAELRFRDGYLVRLAPNSELGIGKQGVTGKTQSLDLVSGEVWSRVNKDSVLEINSPLGSARAGNSDCVVSISEFKDKLSVVVSNGSVQAKTKQGTAITIKKNEEGVLSTAVPPISLPISKHQIEFYESTFKTSERYKAEVMSLNSEVQLGEIVPIQIKLIPVNSDPMAQFQNRITAKSFQSELGVSATQGNFEKSVEVVPSDGTGTVYVRATQPGTYRLTIGGPDLAPVLHVITVGKAASERVAVDQLKRRSFNGSLSVNGFSNDIDVYLDPIQYK